MPREVALAPRLKDSSAPRANVPAHGGGDGSVRCSSGRARRYGHGAEDLLRLGVGAASNWLRHEDAESWPLRATSRDMRKRVSGWVVSFRMPERAVFQPLCCSNPCCALRMRLLEIERVGAVIFRVGVPFHKITESKDHVGVERRRVFALASDDATGWAADESRAVLAARWFERCDGFGGTGEAVGKAVRLA